MLSKNTKNPREEHKSIRLMLWLLAPPVHPPYRLRPTSPSPLLSQWHHHHLALPWTGVNDQRRTNVDAVNQGTVYL